jgi:DNA-binding transcriptional LysR family regulator
VVAEMEAARDAVAPEGQLAGRLRIAAPLTLGPTHFAPVLAQLARRHPKLHVHTSYSDRFVDLVGEGFDAAIRVGYLTDSNLLARRIAPLRGRCVASPDYIATAWRARDARGPGRPRMPDAGHGDVALREAADRSFPFGPRDVSRPTTASPWPPPRSKAWASRPCRIF